MNQDVKNVLSAKAGPNGAEYALNKILAAL